MTKSVTTSLTIGFSSNLDKSVLSLEVDSRPTGYNNGKTSFFAGDSPAFLLYKSPAVALQVLRATQGLIQHIGTVTMVEDEWLECPMASSVNTGKPVDSGMTILGSYGDATTGYSVQESGIYFPTKRLVVLHVQYTTKATAYRITGTLGDAPIIVYALGSV